MDTLRISLVFAAISFCLVFAALSHTMFARISLRFFLCYLLLEALNFSFEWLLVHPHSPYKSAWFAFMMASSFLMAPCVWLFAQEIHNNKPPKVWPPSYGQCAVVLLGFVLTVPLLLSAHGGILLIDHTRPRTIFSQWIHITMVLAVLLYLLQVPWYLMRSLRLFQERERVNKFLFSRIEEPALNALRALIWVMAAHWVLSLAQTLHVMLGGISEFWNLLYSASGVVVMIGALHMIFKHCWQYSQDDQNILQTIAPQINEEHTVSDRKKYAKSSLDDSTRQRILKKVLEQFEQAKIYRISSLKLKDLCDATSESPHYLSQVINQDLKQSFFDLVNRYRIEEAKEKLIHDSSKTILDIALDVGFNSKSTFNKVFKEMTGTTPSGFRESN